MINSRPRVVDLSEVEPNTRRGGDLRAMLTPATVGSTSGFMGVAIIKPGDRILVFHRPARIAYEARLDRTDGGEHRKEVEAKILDVLSIERTGEAGGA